MFVKHLCPPYPPDALALRFNISHQYRGHYIEDEIERRNGTINKLQAKQSSYHV